MQHHLIPSNLFCFLNVVLIQRNVDGPLVQHSPIPTDVASCVSLTDHPVSGPLTELRQIRSAVPTGSQLLQECERNTPVTGYAVWFCY